jgi:hypothetical protein
MNPEQLIRIRTKEGFVYTGKAKWYFDWFKHIFGDFEVIEVF